MASPNAFSTKVSVFLIKVCILLPTLSVGTDPLLLTPYIDKGDVETARKLSEVRDSNYFFKIIPDSHAGFITADRELGNHLFFWFFPSTSDPEAPLLVWLNGGPSVSSMFGLFWENGPLKLKTDHSIFGDPYEKREFSWADPFSMLYIDNPVGAGFSYTESGDEGYRVTPSGYSDDLYSFIEQFYKVFPEYYTRELYIGGQSYAGKYVPAMAHRIHTEIEAKRSRIPLTGIYLGGPYYDPPTESMAFLDYLYSMGTVSHAQVVLHKETIRKFNRSFHDENLEKMTFDKVFPILFSSIDILSLDNYVTGEKPDYYAVEQIMNLRKLRHAVHAGDRVAKTTNFELYSKFGPDSFVSMKSQVTQLLNHYKVLIYTGDYDVIVSSVMVEAALLSTPWNFQREYNESRRTIWKSEDGGTLKGFYSQTKKLCRVVVHAAGHQTPRDQPEITLDMMKDFVKHGCIHEQT